MGLRRARVAMGLQGVGAVLGRRWLLRAPGIAACTQVDTQSRLKRKRGADVRRGVWGFGVGGLQRCAGLVLKDLSSRSRSMLLSVIEKETL